MISLYDFVIKLNNLEIFQELREGYKTPGLGVHNQSTIGCPENYCDALVFKLSY